MSAPLAHHGTRHTGSLRLACATAFIHRTERISSGQISILPKRALLELQNLLPSRDTNNPKRTLRGALLSSLWRAGEDMVHSGLPSRGAAVGNTRNTVLGGLVPTGVKLCLCNHPRSLQQPWSRERGTPLLVHRRVRDETPRPVGTLQSNNTQNIWKSNKTCHLSSRSRCLRCVSIEPCPACQILCLCSRHYVSRVPLQ